MKMVSENATTNTYDKDGNIKKRENLIKLGEWIAYGRLEFGQKLVIGKITDGKPEALGAVLVGNCTPYIQPTFNDGGIGWNWEKYICKFYVLEVYNTLTKNEIEQMKKWAEMDYDTSNWNK